jgi:ubiquinone/menaquinone biosynthesis C-methylase UbiE
MSTSHFDDIATAYDQSLPPHVVEHYLSKRTRFVLDYCPRGQVLDVGCGTGLLATRLAGAGYDVTAVDPSEGMLEFLRGRAPGIDSVQGSGAALPFADDTFDLVLSVAVMHHIADPDEVGRALAEMVRVAKPSGRILVWDHNPRNPYWTSLMARVPQDTGNERLIADHEVIAGLEESGAEILLAAQLGLVPDFTPKRALGLAAAAERAAERIPLLRRLCAHNVILATKRDLHRPAGPAQ